MANNRMRTMSDVTDDKSKNQQESGEESEFESSNETGGGKAQTKPNILRGASYMVLLIAAVFVIHAAMTKSCCGAPWTVVVFTAALGFVLLAYSFYHKSHDRD
jgi:predicted membrane channel-forming protein YqfA (hemolysin III family)